MELRRIREAFESGGTPLIRTDFSDDLAWRAVAVRVSRPVDFNDPDNDEPGADGYAPNVLVVDDRAFEGVDGRVLGDAIAPTGEIAGYVLLADARSMREASGEDLTLDYVDLSVMDPEDAELSNSFTGRSFRVAVAEIASIEANLSIANMNFDEFADAVAPDGVFRGFEAAVLQEPVWPVEREPGLAAARTVLADLVGGTGSRLLSGALGNIVLEREFTGTRTRLFNRVGYAFGWPLCMGASGAARLEVGSEDFYDATLPDLEDAFEQHGDIRTRILEVDKPSRMVKAWNWLLPSATPRLPFREHPTLLERDAVVTIEFTTTRATSEVATTLVKLHLAGIPVEWVEDFRALWNWDIARLATRD